MNPVNTCQFQKTVNAGPLAIGTLATWDGTSQTLVPVDPSNPNIVIFHIIPRGAVGTQPLTITFNLGSTIIAAGLSLPTLLGGPVTLGPSSGLVLSAANNVPLTVTPIAASVGATCLFDVFGYSFSS